MEKISGVEMAQTTQLAIQYAPHPPVHTGDPIQAKLAGQEEIVGLLLVEQQPGFIDPITHAVEAIS